MLPKTGHQGRGGNVSFGHHLGGRSMAECGWEADIISAKNPECHRSTYDKHQCGDAVAD